MPALGRYELLRPIARGGMAEVFLARRRVGGVEKRLVIKRLRRDRYRDPRFLDMFIREAQLSMTLVQQNIVPVFDFGRIGDDVFLAMELIDGRDLGSSLARQRGAGMPALAAAFVAAECAQALEHAHRRREPVIHRDVTPRNVLLSWDGEVKLADFGIAAALGEVAGNAFGTPGYMAPEQALGERVDARADVYALGLVLWEALTGDHVRPVGDPGAALLAARTGELPPVPATIPRPLAAIIERATTRAPSARISSARELAGELDAFMVASRAHAAGEPPAAQLAAWLASRWGAERHLPPPDEDLTPAGSIVTFLDDGEEGVRGAHTARSIAETAAEDGGDRAGATARGVEGAAAAGGAIAPAGDPGAAQARLSARDLLPSDGHPVLREAHGPAPIAARGAAGGGARLRTEADDEEPPARPRVGRAGTALTGPRARRRRVAMWVAAAGIAAVVAALGVARRPSGASAPVLTPGARVAPQPSPAPATEALAAPPARAPAPAIPDAPRVTAPAGSATAPPPPAARPDRAPRRLATDAPPRPPLVAPARGPGPTRAPDAGAGSAAPAPRAIWINALPWAYFTVDGDPKQHETPKLLELPVGPHRLTFTNPQLGISRTVTVTVPAEGDARYVEKMN